MKTTAAPAGARELIAKTIAAWQQRLGGRGEPQAVVLAPGRVNLIGEHTDYNDGFVMPAAIDAWVCFAGSPRADRAVRLYSLDFAQESRFELDEIAPEPAAPWSNYVRGALKLLVESGRLERGFDAALAGTVPVGAGLSSSAAMEIAALRFAQALEPFELGGPELARLGQRVENEFVGVNCGIMDPFASTLGRAGHALLLDCRSLAYEWAPLAGHGVRIVVCDTGVRRELVTSAYNERRAQCEKAVAALAAHRPGIRALRDVDPDFLAAHGAELEPVVRKRAEHVVHENARVEAAARALKAGQIDRFGELMNASHESLRDLYEVSCAELDALVEAARACPGTLGARMTGAGFGGCTVNLVRDEAVDAFRAEVTKRYRAAVGREAKVYVCAAADGAGAVRV
ncbi:MAG TPA: galactokinase [Limnochordia bacterium]|nr:galactokinase [Limnochordia bacterium]